MDNFIGKEYMIGAESIKFDTVISKFNRLQGEKEYTKTKESIRTLGQIEPIYMDDGYCIDGVHRTRAIIELKISKIKAININPKLSIEDKLLLCNKDLTSGRDLNAAQLAIQAYKYAELTNQIKKSVAIQFGVHIKMLTYAGEVKQYIPEAYDSFIKNGKAKIGDKTTTSLEIAYRYINSHIKQRDENIVDNSANPIDYDRLIHTEDGKNLFWEIYNESRRPDSELAIHIVKYVNLRYTKN